MISLKVVGMDSNARITPSSKLDGTTTYISPGGSAQNYNNLPRYAGVEYNEIYPGTGLLFYGTGGSLEYDLHLKPLADPTRIQFGLTGADKAVVDSKGDLILTTGKEQVKFLRPVAYQVNSAGEKTTVGASYKLLAEPNSQQGAFRLSFTLDKYDPARELTIDPVLSYAQDLTYADYYVGAVTADSAGNTYIAGTNSQRGFYVNKYDTNGKLIFNDVIGSGAATVYPTGIAVDSAGKTYIAGFGQTGLPATSNALTTPTTTRQIPFVAVIPAAGGAPTYLSYIGGTTGYDYSSGIAVDASGSFYLTGYESSNNFPVTAGAYLTTFPGVSYAAFVAKFNPTKSGTASLVYSTLVGASGINSYATGIAVDSSDNAYLSVVSNAGYPISTGALNYAGQYSDSYLNGAFVTKLNPTGTALVYSAYVGPGEANAIAIDTTGDAYVTGSVQADDFPVTSGAYQTSYPGGYAAELNPAGTALLYSTFLSGPSGAFDTQSTSVQPTAIALVPACSSNCVSFVSGYTSAVDFPSTNAIQAANTAGVYAPFVVELAGGGKSAVYSTYLSGLTAGYQSIYSLPLPVTPSIAVDAQSNAYVATNIQNGGDLPTTLPIPASTGYAYLAKIGSAAGASIVADPIALNFDRYTQGEAVGVSSTVGGIPVPLILRNLGSTAATISAITFSPSTEFSETDSCAGTIPAGGTCTLNLALTPTAAGVRSATLSIASNAVVSPATVAVTGTAYALGYLQISSPQVNFPDQAIGSASPVTTLTVTNIGKSLVNLQPIALSSVRSNEGNGSDFQALDNCPAQLAAGASCTIGVTFMPYETGLRAAAFALQGDGFGNQTIYLYGTGLVGSNQGTVALSGTMLNFNTQLVNTTSAVQSLTLTNTSTAPVSIYSISIATQGQTGASDFSIRNGSCYNTTSVIQLAAQSSCSLGIVYTPSVASAQTGTVTINDSAAGSPHKVTLSGSGLAASQALEFTPGNFVFADQPVGVPSAAEIFYVFNTGTAPVTIDRVLISGDYLVASTNCPGAILKPSSASGVEPSANCSVRVQFQPTAVGARTGTLTFVDSAGGTQILNLTGTAITASGSVLLEPASLTYPNQALGTASATQHVTIVNPGNSPVTITNVTTTGDYSLSNLCSTLPFSLAAQRTCGVDIAFTPTATTNPRAGTMVVASSSGNATLPLTGSGVTATAAIGLTPTALSFGNIPTTVQSTIYYVYIRNTGSEAITLTSLAASGDYSVSGGSCGFYGNSFQPGTSCYIDVAFTPTATGVRSGVLTLVDSVGTQTAALTGNGVATQSTVELSPNGLGFTQQTVGTTSNTSALSLYNFTAAALTVKSVGISTGAPFVIPAGNDQCTGVTIAAGNSCTVHISFTPTAAGYFTGTLTFTDTASKTYPAALAGYAPPVSVTAYLSPGAIAFPGQVLTTVSNSQTAYLYNTGDLPLTIGTATGTNTIVGASTTGVFSVDGAAGGSDGCSGVQVAPGSRCYVTVVFAPTAAGSATGSVVLPVTYGNGAKANFTLSLSGTGIAVKDAATLSPASLNFPDEAVGAVTNNGADATQVIYLYNTGNLPFTVGTLTGTNAVIGSTTAGDFNTTSAFGGYDGCTGQQVTNGSYCAVTVAFNPAAVGSRSGTISFPVTYADKTTKTLSATLTGKAIAASSKVVVSPTSGQFDVQVVGTTSDGSVTLTFSMSNVGNLPVKIATSTVTSGYSFVSDSCSGTTLSTNDTCQIVLAFSPTKTGVTTGTLTIPDNATGNPHKIALTGTGIAAAQQIVLSQTAIAFQNQVVGTKSPAAYVYVTNQSGATVPISTVVLAGTNASDFIESDGCSGQSLGGHQSCTISVNFSPATASLGSRTATITEKDAATGSPRVITLTGTGIASGPAVALYPASLNFGSQGLNTKSAPLTFSVTNTGSANLTITRVASTNTAEFAIASDACTGKTIASGSNCLVSVTFDPNAGSTQTASIQVTDNATGSPQALSVTGLSVGIPQATFSPTSLTFSSQGVGTTSAAQTITLSNPGTDTLNISSVAITGTNATDFKQTNTCGTSIAAKANCAISITFDPAAVGSRSASLSVTDNANNTAGSVQTAALTGTGTGVQKISFSPASLTFPSTNIGASSATQTITVSNPGSAALTISGITVTPTGDYTQTNACTSSLAAGSTCAITVTFKPSASGTRTASISVADGATGSPQTVALTGTGVGVPAATVSPTTVAFGNQGIGVASAATNVTLTNSGTGPLVVASLKLSGTNATDFTATSSACPGTLAPAAACTIGITFKPAAAGSRTGTLTITDNAGNVQNTTQTVALTGTGAGTPQASYSVKTFAFGNDNVGTESSPLKSILTNTGNGPLSVSSITLTGADPGDFVEFDTCTPSVAAGGNCEIELYFIADAVGARSANVVVTDNANNVVNTTQTLTATGTGTGTPVAKLSATTLSFAAQKVGTQSSGQYITFSNTGNAPLALASVALSGTNAADFSLFNSCGTSVGAGDSCVVVVFFTPSATGARSAIITLTDNTGNVTGSKQTIALSGTGN
ncbi:beta strand repeat-containing protein [Granulicella sibirica]|nr:choice-of-anchor D domain-containing protein [Granulicella sibirica]